MWVVLGKGFELAAQIGAKLFLIIVCAKEELTLALQLTDHL